jgi:8-oxo-dGTP pyrophosphatase MutT (NUDIX family)
VGLKWPINLTNHPSWRPSFDWTQACFGGVVYELRKGLPHYLLCESRDHFNGYVWTLPKGSKQTAQEEGIYTALREVSEESGHICRPTGTVPGNFSSGSGRTNNYFLLESHHIDNSLRDDETQSTCWATFADAQLLIHETSNVGGRTRDLNVLNAAHTILTTNLGESSPAMTELLNSIQSLRSDFSTWKVYGMKKPVKRVLKALKSLTAEDFHRLNLAARKLEEKCRSYCTKEDLIQETFALVLAGNRRWPPKVKFIVFLLMTMRGIAWNISVKARRELPLAPDK